MPGDRQALRQNLYRLAAAQAGYFTAAQALDVGYSYRPRSTTPTTATGLTWTVASTGSPNGHRVCMTDWCAGGCGRSSVPWCRMTRRPPPTDLASSTRRRFTSPCRPTSGSDDPQLVLHFGRLPDRDVDDARWRADLDGAPNRAGPARDHGGRGTRGGSDRRCSRHGCHDGRADQSSPR